MTHDWGVGIFNLTGKNLRINCLQRCFILLKDFEHCVIPLLVETINFLNVLGVIALFHVSTLDQILQRLHEIDLVGLLQGNRQQLHFNLFRDSKCL
jgi:hypothetical protein